MLPAVTHVRRSQQEHRVGRVGLDYSAQPGDAQLQLPRIGDVLRATDPANPIPMTAPIPRAFSRMPGTDTTFERLAMPTAVQHQAIELISGQLKNSSRSRKQKQGNAGIRVISRIPAFSLT